MAVVPYAYRLSPTPPVCATARSVCVAARDGGGAALAALARALLAAAGAHEAVLEGFGLVDADFVAGWIEPATVHPALATLLGWVPLLERLGDSDARTLAELHRVGGSPIGTERFPTRFHALPSLLPRIVGKTPLDGRLTLPGLGQWIRAARLPGGARADDDGWLITATRW